jgi:uncharacterized membrane protein YobD (UPF0266 family)
LVDGVIIIIIIIIIIYQSMVSQSSSLILAIDVVFTFRPPLPTASVIVKNRQG